MFERVTITFGENPNLDIRIYGSYIEFGRTVSYDHTIPANSNNAYELFASSCGCNTDCPYDINVNVIGPFGPLSRCATCNYPEVDVGCGCGQPISACTTTIQPLATCVKDCNGAYKNV
jgi:hypothetical protein